MSVKNTIVILFHGPSGSGKSHTAKEIAAPNGVITQWDHDQTKIVMDHKFLAAPLSEMHSIKVNTQGANAADRQLWMLHQVMADLFSPLSMPFDDFVELIYDAQAWDLKWTSKEGVIVKDRDFMTGFADKCHALTDNPFAKHLARSIKSDLNKDWELNDRNLLYVPIVSDLRLRRELDYIESRFEHVVKFKLSVSEQEINRRLVQRDGSVLTEYQWGHETQVSPFSNDEFDHIIPSDDMDLPTQVDLTRKLINEEMTTRGLI